jgi:hypothetical protein
MDGEGLSHRGAVAADREDAPLLSPGTDRTAKRPRAVGSELLPPKAAERERRARLHSRSIRVESRSTASGDGYDSDIEVLRGQRPRYREAPPLRRVTLRRRVYIAMNGNSSTTAATVFKTLLTLVILLNVVVFMVSTLPGVEVRYRSFFDFEEAAVSSLFLVEYLTRLWTCVESHKYCGWRGRLRYMLRYSAICDALATFPFFLETAVSLIFPSARLPNTTIVRMFSIFRVLKTERSAPALETLT